MEVRTDRPVTDSPANKSYQSSAQLRWIPGSMPNSDHFDFSVHFIANEINRARPAMNAGPASGFGKSKRLPGNRRNHFAHFQCKPDTPALGLALVPGHGLLKFSRGVGV